MRECGAGLRLPSSVADRCGPSHTAVRPPQGVLGCYFRSENVSRRPRAGDSLALADNLAMPQPRGGRGSGTQPMQLRVAAW
ncbi:MAG: hypothetical protein COZ47_04785 [Lysobacterales bacterium CG_4_10_14_3_um_filter_64_11]|nr:MAG: hypothetical protein COZ47_04785 [Xanthomonadales bacterium CG_4_10_14_3_um_filter_64_11]